MMMMMKMRMRKRKKKKRKSITRIGMLTLVSARIRF
jgi:hypothetical protein